MKILCIDDDYSVRWVFMTGLTNLLPEDDLFEASSGEEAMTVLQQRQFDLVVTDLVMPGLSGLEVLRIVKERSPTTEVIVVTGHPSIGTVVEVMRAGARDYIEKSSDLSLDLSLLKEKIEDVREYRQRVNEAEEFRLAKDLLRTASQPRSTPAGTPPARRTRGHRSSHGRNGTRQRQGCRCAVNPGSDDPAILPRKGMSTR